MFCLEICSPEYLIVKAVVVLFKVQIESCEDPLVSKYCMRGILIGKKKNLDMFD